MQFLRRHNGLFARLAGLAMMAHVLASPFCPNMNSHSRGAGYFDAALGWVTLCLSGSTAATPVQGALGGKDGPSGHGGLCAALCASVVATIAVVAAIFISALAYLTLTRVFFLVRREPARPHILFGGIGSRAPPALVCVHLSLNLRTGSAFARPHPIFWDFPMFYSRLPLTALAACFSPYMTATAFAHGDSGGGGGVILPPGVTLVSLDYDVTKFNEISDGRLTDLALQGVGEVHSLKTISVPALTLGYGLTRDLTVAVRLPYLHNEEIRETDPDNGGVNPRGGVSGFGDASFTGTYRFYNDHGTGLEAALIAGIKAPTGATGRADVSGDRFETEHQPGSGSWDGIAGGTLSRKFESLTLGANVLYQFSGSGTADTTLGDRLNYGVTASYRVWSLGGHDRHEVASHLGAAFDGIMHHGGPHDDGEVGHQHHSHGAEPIHDHADGGSGTAIDLSLGLNGEWMGKVDTAGEVNENTGGNVLFLTPGVKLTVDAWSIYINAGIPIAREFNGIQSDPDWRLATGVAIHF